jgi:ketosteroid isomerase-like protein
MEGEHTMDDTHVKAGPAAVVHRLERATNERDLETLVACFAANYRNETPAHPERGFTGQDQVRTNWSQIFAAIPDLTCEVLDCTVEGSTVWSEWEHRGTRPDGTPHLMRGVIIFGVADGVLAWARFYLEPVQAQAGTVDQALRRQVLPGARS